MTAQATKTTPVKSDACSGEEGVLPEAPHIFPVLRSVTWEPTIRLADDGTFDEPAHVTLSHTLAAGFVFQGMDLSLHTVCTFWPTLQTAWNAAAANVVNYLFNNGPTGSGADGITFFARPATHITGFPCPGLQLATPGVPDSAWLAHPRLLALAATHAQKLLNGDKPVFLCPTDTALVICPEQALTSQLRQWCRDKHAAGTGGVPVPIIRRDGFPAAQ